ncbi:RHS repeat-associated core domain-containing protein [Algibacter sp. 2305UL17-15]|uniref:RHS repeat domain-containing protein n=1 Tax=Algibacter sp. 2305UL17-15 TaxID=3231268 RepID=UPI00345A1EB0
MTLPDRNGAVEPSLYRYGFNGMEKDDAIKGEGNSYTTYFRQYDPRIGRWLTIDPASVTWESPYVAQRNNPILFNDPFGDCPDGNCDDVKNPGGGNTSIPGNSTNLGYKDIVVGFMHNGDQYFWSHIENDYVSTGHLRNTWNNGDLGMSGSTPRYVKIAGEAVLDYRERFSNPSLYLVKTYSEEKGNGVEVALPSGTDKNGDLYAGVFVLKGGKTEWFESEFPEVGAGESMIPVYGSSMMAMQNFEDGEIGWGIFNSAMAVSDIFLVKSLFTGIAKGGVVGFGKNYKNWSSWRKFYGEKGFAKKGQDVHHWLFEKGASSGSGSWWKAKNQMWNLKPMAPS